ncbi:hypothetical protein N7517_004966 [Penicillium concentricum]|uniref:Uncharacterized protein n=1 Tax=Penicillium concentricum TaxID=293559 RepID=A0A9W9S7U0_9EURO|nr:uncharacterized protein N7517_004966 [Penicillium concentricum]KAJ5372960.1 hypothetical protein N7517_004966 [Penicillium concentricum]
MMQLLLYNHVDYMEYSTDASASKASKKDDKPSTNTPSPTGPQYDSVWYSPPLDDPSVGSRKNYHEKRVALRSLKSVKDRIDHDIAKVAGFLTETGHMDSSDDEDDSGAENVFSGFKLIKVGTEAEWEKGDEEEDEEDEQDDDVEGREQNGDGSHEEDPDEEELMEGEEEDERDE